LDRCGALLLFEDRVVAKAFTLRLFAVVASWVRFVALGQQKRVRDCKVNKEKVLVEFAGPAAE
jgi:hypothetical protein